MTNGNAPARDVHEFLIEQGAGDIRHPGGTLYSHVLRVAALLREWGADSDLQAAGLCHACYGTDGFQPSLIDPGQRPMLRSLIGARAEALVYLYGSCDRAYVYPLLGTSGAVPFRDRFNNSFSTPTEIDVRAFAELTAANELDVVRHNADVQARHGEALRSLVLKMDSLLTEQAKSACQDMSSPADAEKDDEDPARKPITITGVDHVVLTVADPDLTTDFYQRILGMRPITFGEGRRALNFGSNKFNLHEVGQEVAPYASHPMPGSVDICLVTSDSPAEVVTRLQAMHVPIEQGPVLRTGAIGRIISVYLHDPDGNLIEIASYPPHGGSAR